MKKTLVLGASPNPSRYSNIAVNRLISYGHEVVPVGVREGEIAEIEIIKGRPEVEGIDTVTLYLNPKRQVEYYDYILGLNPKRIIFNPGTENPELSRLAREQGIETEVACTLVQLSIGDY
ncbi:MAG: putative CoA-binding protein [Saprospiraceae bacterium]|jgi:predicted CoA-binding protein